MESQQTNDSRRKFLIKSGKVGAVGALFATFPNRSVLAQQTKDWSPSAAASMTPSAAPLAGPIGPLDSPTVTYKRIPSAWPNIYPNDFHSGIDLNDSSLFKNSKPLELKGTVTNALKNPSNWFNYIDPSKAAKLSDLFCNTATEVVTPFAGSSFEHDPILGVLWVQNNNEANRIRIGVTTLFNSLRNKDYPFDFEFACILVRDMMNGNRPDGYRLPDGITRVSKFLKDIYQV